MSVSAAQIWSSPILDEIEAAGTTVNKDIDKSQFKPYAEKVYEQYKDAYGTYIERIQNGDY